MNDFSHFRLRLPVDLKEIIEKEAKKNNRSINAEILYILSSYFKTLNTPSINEINYSKIFDTLLVHLKRLDAISKKLEKRNYKDI